MAPRKQAKQPAAEDVVTASADGNVTPPKKRKVAAKPAVADEPKQAKAKSRQAKANTQGNEKAGKPASSPRKLRSRQGNANVADTAIATVAKNDTKSKPKKQVNKPEDTVDAYNHVGEEVAEKKTRGGKTAATAKKAGTKTAVAKPKAPVARKPKTQPMGQDGVSEKKKNSGGTPAKRTTRRMKAEENNAPAQPIAKVSRKRKNVENTNEAVAEEKNQAKVASKKPRSKAKKVENDDAPVTTSKGRVKKNVKETAKPEEAEIEKQNSKKQNAEIQKDTSTKNVKKRNTKKAAPKGKLAAVEKAEVQAEEDVEEDVTSEVDVKENGEAHMVDLKQKKKNAKKANAAMNGKVEAKGKQKKGQAATEIVEKEVDEEETTQNVTEEKNEATEMNVTSKTDEYNIKDISSNIDGDVFLNEEEENYANNSTKDLIQDNSNTSEKSIKEGERSGTFLCF